MDNVDNSWSFLAFVLVTGAFQAFLAASWVVIGGLGGQWRVNQALSRQAQELSNLDRRVTREQKVRAGEKRQELPREEARAAKTLAVEAAERLAAEATSPASSGRPSTLSSINGGG